MLRQLLDGARMGRCHGLREELALTFAMGTLGALSGGRWALGKEAVAAGAGQITGGGARGGGQGVAFKQCMHSYSRRITGTLSRPRP